MMLLTRHTPACLLSCSLLSATFFFPSNELTMADDGQKQLSVRLSSKDGSYAIPSSNFFVPSSWRRFHLSELINRVLEHGEHALAASLLTAARG